MTYLAKENGISLKEHSIKVSETALKILKIIIPCIKEDKEIYQTVKLAGLLHDIGKISENFQNILQGKKQSKKSNKFRHNEVSWAIIQRYLDHQYKDGISNAAYWHHGISNPVNKFYTNDILDDIKLPDENEIKSMFLELGIDCFKIDEHDSKTPLFFEKFDEGNEYQNEENISNLIIRTCLISADRIISSIEKEKDFDILLVQELNKINKNDIIIENPYNNERYYKQVRIAEENKDEQTIMLNAPAGFGKTISGILWSQLSKRKLLWICPNNTIAKAVYKNVKNELKTNGINNINIELYLTGEVKESTIPNNNGFNADIIITNIDNFLKPTIDNSNMDRLYYLLSCDVIFDEYDQLICESALYADFILIMKARHCRTSARTLLLSATYQNINKNWENKDKKTCILPGKYKHYEAQHNKKFKICVVDNFDIFSENTLNVVNSIKLSQELYKRNDEGILIHSEFEDDKKEKIINEIYDLYSLTNNNKLKKNVIGTHVIQTAHNISFKYLIESVMSPTSTVQRKGRHGRDEEYADNEAIFYITNSQSKSEEKIIELLYDKNLKNAWFNFLSKKDGQSLTLDEFYILYNQFLQDNEKAIGKYLTKKYRESCETLLKIYPKKYDSVLSKDGNIKAGSNKLRTTGVENFVIARKYNSNKFCNPFNCKIYNNFSGTFKEDRDTFEKIVKVMKELSNDERFDYKELLENKKLTPEIFQEESKFSSTPYIRFDKVYHEDYGFISTNFFND